MSSNQTNSNNVNNEDDPELEGEEKVQMLLKALKAHQMMIRTSATEVLIDMLSQDLKLTLPLLMTAIKDAEWWTVRFGAVDAISGSVEQENVPIPDESIKILANYLKDDDVEFRAKVASALGIIGNKLAVPYLIKILDDKEDETREMAAIALGNIGDKQSTDVLMKHLVIDSSEYVQSASATSIGQIEKGSAESFQYVNQFIKKLHSPDRLYRAIVIALGKIQNNKAIVPLIHSFSNPSASPEGREDNLAALKTFKQSTILEEIELSSNGDENLYLDLIEDAVFHYPFEALITESLARKERLIGKYQRSFQRMKGEIETINSYVADTFKTLNTVNDIVKLKTMLGSIPRKRKNLARINLSELMKYKWVTKSLFIELKEAEKWYQLGQGALDELEISIQSRINLITS